MIRILFLLMLGVVSACSIQPDPIRYGKDSCHSCKMTLTDRRFGAEVISKKGKVFKFDDTNCLVGFLKSGFLGKDEIAMTLVVAHNTANGSLIDATTAYFVQSTTFRSPMRGDIAAFASQMEAKTAASQVGGELMTWEQVLAAF